MTGETEDTWTPLPVFPKSILIYSENNQILSSITSELDLKLIFEVQIIIIPRH